MLKQCATATLDKQIFKVNKQYLPERVQRDDISDNITTMTFKGGAGALKTREKDDICV